VIGAVLAALVLTSSGFGIIRHRPDLALIPAVFYAGFLWTAVAIAHATFPARRPILAALVIGIALVSVPLSVSAGVRQQWVQSSLSAQGLNASYEVLYGRYSVGATIPAARRLAEAERLRSFGIAGPLPAGISALDILYCGGRALPIVGVTQRPSCSR
jgi:hypothetical protein